MNWVNIFFVCATICLFSMNSWSLLLCCFQLLQLASLSLGLSHTHFGLLKSIQEQLWIWQIVRHHSHVFLISCFQPYSPCPFIQNVEIKDLDFSYPFLLFRREIFLSQKILQVVVVCFNKKNFTEHKLVPFNKGMHYCQHFLVVCGFCLLTWF